jgi:hypothetical protein
VSAAPALTLLDAHFRPDVVLPEFARLWHYAVADREKWSEEQLRDWYAQRPLGGGIHVFFRNDGREPLTFKDVLLGGFSLQRVIAFSDQRIKRKPASIFFADLPKAQLDRLVALGEPVWWRVQPGRVDPGGVGEIYIRLRARPRAAQVELVLQHSGGTQKYSVPVGAGLPRVESVSFDDRQQRIFACLRYPDHPQAQVKRVLLDGQDMTAGASIVSDQRFELSPFEVQLPRSWPVGSFHCLQAVYEDDSVASTMIRVWQDEFMCGIWGGRSGKEGDSAGAIAHLRRLAENNLNLQMPQVGSAMLSSFYATPQGRRWLVQNDFGLMVNEPGKWGAEDPYAFFIHDEPDCGDALIKGLPAGHEVGSLAQWAQSRHEELRAADSQVPTVLNVDSSFKPENWYTYGQLPDLYCTDPYYQPRLWEAYGKHPDRLEIYKKATYVLAAGSICRSACAPNPLHVVLYACRRARQESRFDRFPTPPEKRIEAYYALAAGAKGLSYWWYTPTGGKSVGVGSDDPAARALWREIGLISAEARTAGPLLVKACPIEVSHRSTSGVWLRALACGNDSLVLLIVNDQYENTDVGTQIRPVESAEMAVRLPSWVEPKSVFTIGPEGVRPARAERSASLLKLSLGRLEVTRLVVVTSDPRVQSDLASRFEALFARNNKRIMAAAGS